MLQVQKADSYLTKESQVTGKSNSVQGTETAGLPAHCLPFSINYFGQLSKLTD